MEKKNLAVATFAGGCFWCLEPPFSNKEGVIETLPGYSGGKEENPTYEDVCQGRTSHLEVMQITFDKDVVSYPELLDIFWKNIDPTDQGGQFVDRGKQYATAIFYHDEEQKVLAEKSKEELVSSGKFQGQIVTDIRCFKIFYEAEDYHQSFYQKSPTRYKSYRNNSGRDQYLTSVWKK